MSKIPDWFKCIITHDIMCYPVIDREGNTYEKSAIEEWLINNNTSPITRNPLSIDDLSTNRSLKNAIEDFKNSKSTEPTSEDISMEVDLDLCTNPSKRPQVCGSSDGMRGGRGITPDLIINPNTIPSGMTARQLIESITGIVGPPSASEMGQIFNVDLNAIGDILEKNGFARDGRMRSENTIKANYLLNQYRVDSYHNKFYQSMTLRQMWQDKEKRYPIMEVD